jgi:hypothetical protein
MKARCFLGILFVAGCPASAPEVCDDLPPRFATPVVVAEMPRTTGLPRAALDADGSFLAWSEAADDPTRSVLRARCVAADGAPRGELAIPIDGHIAALEAVRAPDGDHYHAVYGVWAAGHTGDPVAHFAIDLDCEGSSAPVPIGMPAANAAVTALVAIDGGYAFVITTPDVASLWIDVGGELTDRPITSPAVWGALAANATSIAFVALDADAIAIYTFTLDGAPRLGPVLASGITDVYDGGACWDGDGWSVVLHTRTMGRGEVLYGRFDPTTGELAAPVRISDGAGRSFDPAIACSDGAAAVAFRRNAGGVVPGTDLVTSTIDLVELSTDDGAVRHGPIELEPPDARLSVFPTIATGARLIATWTAFDADGYEQRFATTGDRCALE